MSEPPPWWFVVPALVVLGGTIGSFLTSVVWRVPQRLSIVHARSACPRCGHAISWFDSIPVISYLVLGGRCRHCASRISLRYPSVEAATAVAFGVAGAGAYAELYPSPFLPALLYWAAVGVALTVIDIDHHRLPNVIVLPSYLVTVALLLLASVLTDDYGRMATAMLGCAILFAVYAILALASPHGMGLGDVKLAGALGLLLGWLGWTALVIGGFSAFLLGGVVGAALLIGRRATGESRIPFGPFMLAGAGLGVFVGGSIAASSLDVAGIA